MSTVSEVDEIELNGVTSNADENLLDSEEKKCQPTPTHKSVDELIDGLWRKKPISPFAMLSASSGTASIYSLCFTFMVESSHDICQDGLTNNDCVANALSASDLWDISGDYAYRRAIMQGAYFIGQLFSSYICGILADIVGRVPVYRASIVINILSGILMCFAGSWKFYAWVKFFGGLSHSGLYSVGSVIGFETNCSQYRRHVSTFANIASAIGGIVLAILAYFFVNFHDLHIAIAIISGILILSFVYTIESPRWLITKGKLDEAQKVLNAIARKNGTTLPDDWRSLLEVPNTSSNSSSAIMIEPFRNVKILKQFLPCLLMWFNTTMSFYGITMKSDIGGGYPFFTFGLLHTVDIIAQLFLLFFIDKIGRKVFYSFSTISFALLLFINWLTKDYVSVTISIANIVAAKFCVSISYTILSTFTSELFPTLIRNTILGYCSAFARVGAIASTFLVDIKVMVFMSLISAILTSCALYFLPETLGQKLPDSVSETKNENDQNDA
ncbi:unnamed protein product [Caenorhabditis bovis]|uniref:Major facilitator superfamily (MFS) profile domain-containing protein n=1 Tax=Caenorhabditis bovis TaxID=2654633 RepID=A0A8S1FCN6_9PELO|nr:unnamed protein product [Caenorhabditis bovis]